MTKRNKIMGCLTPVVKVLNLSLQSKAVDA